MGELINVFLETPMLMTAVIVFFLCVIIGFFGNMYLKRNDKIKSVVNVQTENVKEENQEDEKDEKSINIEKKDADSGISTTTNDSLDDDNQNNKVVTQDDFINLNNDKFYSNDDNNINNIF